MRARPVSRCTQVIVQNRPARSCRRIASLSQPRIARRRAPPHRRGADRVAGERGHRGGLGALAADVADHRDPLVLADAEQVVEVAAHVGALARGPVERRAVDARRSRAARAAAASSAACARSPSAAGACARCRPRRRRGARTPPRARAAPGRAARPDAGHGEREHAEALAAQRHRHAQRGADAQLREQLVVARVARGGGDVRRVDLAVELGAARARDRRRALGALTGR